MRTFKNILVTGGAGFIGSNFIHWLFAQNDFTGRIINLDALTYAGNLENLADIEPRYGELAGKSGGQRRYFFVKGDICDRPLVERIFSEYRIDTVVHFAAESHVDRSILGPEAFMRTNVMGTYTLLDVARNAWKNPDGSLREDVLFHHVSTDEVFGSLGDKGYFTEETPYDPRSPYSASKAASDHLVRAWHHTYGLPVLITNCSNNYGPFHFPEKLIPLVILNALDRRPLPVYGAGDNVRDWLYVEDHARALRLVLQRGRPGETYNVGGSNERTNLQVVETICDILDKLHPCAEEHDKCLQKNDKRSFCQPSTINHQPAKAIKSYKDLITFVSDRPGHDKRYAIDAAKLRGELGWTPLETFETGIRKTVQWYLDNVWWWQPIRDKKYAGQRLGRT